MNEPQTLSTRAGLGRLACSSSPMADLARGGTFLGTTMKTIGQQIDALIPEWIRLFKSLKPTIGDDYRASDDADDDKPAMCVTIGFTPADEDSDASWSYQTGDNSFTGGAYSHPHWAVVTLTRRSNSAELAKEAADQIGELVCS